MYLKKLIIKNYRKFGENENEVNFTDASFYIHQGIGDEETDSNIATTTTLIVGKNNSGKSTITSILDKIVNKPSSFGAFDFNVKYLKENLYMLKENPDEYKAPMIAVKIIIGLDDESEDLVTNYIPFMSLDALENQEIEITVKYQVNESQILKRALLKVLSDYDGYDDAIIFSKYASAINENKFSINYFDVNDEKVVGFKINELIELKPINAITVSNENSLSNAFCKIIEYRYKETIAGEKELELDKEILEINSKLNDVIKEEHSDEINQSFSKIISSDKLNILLSSDLSFSRLFKDLIKYEYIDGDNIIPENQFGLGYTNLVTIIAKLIDYMEQYGDAAFNSKINLVSIEEPETYMHPQMQEVFINNINDAIEFLLESRDKKINTQLIITTHSSHILNSKIHSGNSFDNINYIVSKGGYSNAVVLNDDKVNPSSEGEIEDLKFLKKHIKFKASDLFFADAVIFVEGITEETFLKNYIERDNELSKYYITIFNIDGAHGLVYHNLIKLLKIPCLVITDLDIQRTEIEKREAKSNTFRQVTSLNNRITTNKTIRAYNNKSKEDKKGRKLYDFPIRFEFDNLFIAYQTEVNGFYPTSFEESLILSNYDNTVLNNALFMTKPRIYKNIVGKDSDFEKLKENSYKLQVKLSTSKSDFANNLLYSIINKREEDNDLSVPDYIKYGLEWLITKVKGDM